MLRFDLDGLLLRKGSIKRRRGVICSRIYMRAVQTDGALCAPQWGMGTPYLLFRLNPFHKPKSIQLNSDFLSEKMSSAARFLK